MNKIINKSETYYIYNIVNSTFIVKLDSKQELINWLAYRQSLEKSWLENDYNNRYLNYLNMTFEDKYFVCDFRESGYLKREYMVLDGYDRIIDIRCFYKEILEVAIKESNKPYRYNRGTWYISTMQRKVGKGYKGAKFRQEPIPYISNRGRYTNYRQIRTTNEIRQNSDKEIQEYIRPSRRKNSFPDYWDEISRHNEKSWKYQTKNKKQWMKNLK